MAAIALDSRNLPVWEANIKELEARQPELAWKLKAWVEENGHAFEHDEMATEAGVWVSGLTPEPFFQQTALPDKPWGKGEEKDVSVVFVYGIGIAPWLFSMARALPNGTLAIVAVEPNLSLLAYLLHTTHIYMAVPEGCRLSFAMEARESPMDEALMVNLMPLGTYIAANAKIWTHPGEMETFAQPMKALQQTLRERVITKLQELGNSAEDTLLGFRQIAISSPWIVLASSLADVCSDYRGRPFIWVASGPSLDKNVHLLKENNDRAVIICADTAVRKLLQNGITPHITVALERGMPVYSYLSQIWTDYPEEAKKILLVSQAICVPEVAGKWPGPKIVVGKLEIPVDNWFIGGVLGGDLLYSGLSVAHMGVWLASAMGASSLALMGQDLAFGGGRRSHASSTVNDATAKGEAEGTWRILKKDFVVPGALGGTVVTHEIWFLFLRVMERFVPMLGMPVSDCTEGGALIQGTTVRPLSEWMAEHLDETKLVPFEASPAEVVSNASRKTPELRAEIVRQVTERVGQGIDFIKETRRKLEDAARLMEQVSAPGLSPVQRRNLAMKMSLSLDELHRSNPVLEFVGQSQMTLNAAVISETRYLDDVFAVAEWKRVHQEIIDGHNAALNFMETWLMYAGSAVEKINKYWDDGYSLETLPFLKPEEVIDLNPYERDLRAPEAIEQLRRIAGAETSEELLEAQVLLDNLIARADYKWWRYWDDRIDWKVGLALEHVGRNAEAAHFLWRMEYSSMGVYGLPHDAGIAFLKDTARIISSNDMCYIPRFDAARLYVQNALEMEPGDAGAEKLLSDINAKALRYYTDLMMVAKEPGRDTPQGLSSEWAVDRAKAEQAISDHDLGRAFRLVWDIVKKFVLVIPDGASDYLEWLTEHISRAEKSGARLEGADDIKREIFKWMPLFREVKAKVSPSFLGHIAEETATEKRQPLAEQGIKA